MLEELLGFDAELAARIAATREQAGGFSSIEDAAFVLDLPAHVVEQLASGPSSSRSRARGRLVHSWTRIS